MTSQRLPHGVLRARNLVLLVMVLTAIGVACRGGGANPSEDDLVVPVIQPTAASSLCLNDEYPAGNPNFGDVDDAILQPQVSGLRFHDIVVGTGENPQFDSIVTVQYTGWLEDGCIFDSSRVRGNPSTFGVTQVIGGWTEALLGMQVGGQRRIVIPPELGYGTVGFPPVIPASATLTFDIELVEVISLEDAQATVTARQPEQTATAQAAICQSVPHPSDAPQFTDVDQSAFTFTDSGLGIRDVVEGTGDTPGEGGIVTVNYVGWLIDGCVFDSSYAGGDTISFPLNQVIPGWTEGIGGMKVGGRRQLQIPAALGYGDRGFQPVIPGGATLFFDVELVEIN